MKKKVFSALILLCLVLCTIPMAGTAFADDSHGLTHCICGGGLDGQLHPEANESGCDPSLSFSQDGIQTLPESKGCYYLAGDITLSADWAVPAGETVICLNGHDINLNGHTITVKGSSRSQTTCSLTITDCNKTAQGSIVSTGATAVEIGEKGTFNMYGGTISGAKEASAVKLTASSAVFNMYGGKLSGNDVKSEANNAVVYNAGTFKMSHASEISGNGDESNITYQPQNIVKNDDGKFYMSGESKISGNHISGACVSNVKNSAGAAQFIMSGGEISNNTGGLQTVYIGNSTSTEKANKFIMTGGKITGNKGATVDAFNHVVNMELLYTEFEMSGDAEISGNTTKYSVVCNRTGTFTMSGGKITNNSVTGSSSIGGIESNVTPAVIYNKGDTDKDHTASFTMSGGEISGNTVGGGSAGSTVLLNDSKVEFTMSGTALIKGNKALNGAGVYNNGGSFTMDGGTIGGTGNYDFNTAGENGGGVYNKGTFNMNGGSIINNVATNDGGGVYNDENGTFTMSNGSIEMNHAVNGGGIYNKGTLELSGGTVGGGDKDGNVASTNGGGICYADGKVTINGNVSVKNNKKPIVSSTGSTTPTYSDNNLYIAKDKKLTLAAATDTLTQKNIGITLATDYGSFPAEFAATADIENPVTANYTDVFFSDDDGYKVHQSRLGDALQLSSTTHNITYKLAPEGSSVTLEGGVSLQTTYVEGTAVNLPTSENIKREGYELFGWYRNADLSGEPVSSVGENDTEDITLYAAWEPKNSSITIAPSTDSLNMTYGDNDKSFKVSVVAPGCTINYEWFVQEYDIDPLRAIDGASKNQYTIPGNKAAGTYTYYCRVTVIDPAAQEIVTKTSSPMKLTLNEKKLEITGTATAKAGLTYSANATTGEGVAQKLLENPSGLSTTDGVGSIYYAVTSSSTTSPEEEDYRPDAPTATDAGTYYVWYRAYTNNLNYADGDVCAEPIRVEIAKATYTGDKTASASLVYGRDGEVDLTNLIVTGGTASYEEEDNKVDSDGIVKNSRLNNDGNKLQFNVKEYNDNESATNTATCTIHVTSRNYQDYDIVVTITALDKAPQSITVSDKHANGTVNYDSEGGKYKAKYEYIDLYSNDIKYGITAAAEADETGAAAGVAGDISYEVTSGRDVLSINGATGEITDILGIGTATVTVTAAETDDYKKATTTVEITITKKSQSLSDTLYKPVGATTLIYTGEEQVLITDTKAVMLTSTGKLLFTLGTDTAPYDRESNPAPDEAFDYGFKETIPTGINAGTYYVWYKAAGDDYTEESKPCTKPVSVKISQATNAWTTEPSIAGWTYGETASTPSKGTASFGSDVKVEYKAADEADTKYSTDIPQQAGNYKARFSVEGNSNYTTLSKEIDFEIAKATLTDVSVEQSGSLSYTGEPQTATVTAKATAKGNQEVSFTYCDTENGTYSESVPAFTNAGEHTVYYKVSADNHNTESGNFEITIGKAQNSWTTEPSIEGWTYGKAASTPSAAAKFGNVKVSYNKIESDQTVTAIEGTPTEVGEYEAIFTVSETEDYSGLSAKASFSIKRQSSGGAPLNVPSDNEAKTDDEAKTDEKTDSGSSDQAQTENGIKAKELVGKIYLTARSSKTAKGNIKVVLKVNEESAAAIKALKNLGYTVKYKYYRSTKKASKYAAKITKTTNTYTNTKGMKGKRYYYKARVQVLDKDGNLVAQTALKQCRYAARIWSR